MGNTHSGKSGNHWKNPEIQVFPENSHPCKTLSSIYDLRHEIDITSDVPQSYKYS
jgi:hypothetical protein